MAHTQLRSIGQLYEQSSQAVRRNLTLFIFLNSLTILGTAWNIGLSVRDKSHGSNWGQVFFHTFSGSANDPGLSSTIGLIFIVVGIILYLLVLVLSVKAASQSTVQFGDVWETFKNKWWKIILVEILFLIIVVGGLIVLIIPGLYLISRLALSGIVVIDQDCSVIEALNKSWEMTRKLAWPVFITVFFGALLSLPSIVPIIGPIVAMVLTIAYSVALPIRYYELKGLKAVDG